RDIERKDDEDQDVHRIDDAHPAEVGHHPRETVEIPEQDSGEALNRKQQEHDNLVRHALQRIELSVKAQMMRIRRSLEDAITVIEDLARGRAKMLHRV